MKRWTIYSLHDPSTDAVRYIGCTSTSLAVRLCRAMGNAKAAKRPTPVQRWLLALYAAGQKPRAHALLSVLPRADWQQAEVAAIAAARIDCDLLNCTDGGLGMRGTKASDATREARSASLRRRYADPAALAVRQELAREAARSESSRRLSSERMRAIWSDPVRSAEMRSAMRGAKARRAKEVAC
jgi:hypothetical protein